MIELLVGAAIALLGLVAMAEAFLSFDLQRRVSGGGMDAQTAAGTALFRIEREAQEAGLGISDARFTGCAVAFNAGQAAQPLMAVHIVQGSGGAPDSLVLVAGDGHAAPTQLVAGLTAGGELALATTLGMAADDIVLLQESGKACSLVRIGSVQSAQRASRVALDGSALNASADTIPAGGYTAAALAVDLGRLQTITYSVTDAGLMRRADAPGQTGVDMPIASDIVSLKAQYGFDTRSGARGDLRVDRWSAAMMDADGDGIVGGAGDLQRIGAIRLAIVARSNARTQRGSCNATGGASASSSTVATTTTTATTTSAGPGNTPQWQAADANGKLGAQGISLTHLPDWQCYRYRVYDTVIALRNPLWGLP
ncbi:PilW family protein [Noviherbaspirillum sp. DKR-6]|uniref:PilW family protein n=2 Tax=Noviherbaspirillum pedocola TaxID=2801341 RepID=A0A934SZX1_9BURK|nr:PilW family protein [Noviherbaspirillum pedocola]